MRPTLLLIVASLLVAPLLSHSQAQDGLFANIRTTLGTIRVVLHPNEAPLAVSNFIGLIEGSQKAIDPSTGKLIEGGFYDGVEFHRVISDFMIQTGSPTGLGTDGPGYTFQDEFHPTRTFDSPFVLAMANSGPNTNGSQFFITVSPRPELNNVHTVFGTVVSGSDVATTLSEVTTDETDRPQERFIIETITLERVGTEAESFQLNLADLPKVRTIEPRLRNVNGNYLIDIAYQVRSEYRLFLSTDLQTWASQRIAFTSESIPSTKFNIGSLIAAQSQGYFRVTETSYPVVIFPSSALGGNTLDAQITEFSGFPQNTFMTYRFEGANYAEATLKNGTKGDVTGYSYRIEGPTRATLVLPSTLAAPFSLVQFILNFASATTGNFIAFLPNAFPVPTRMSGTFTLNDTTL